MRTGTSIVILSIVVGMLMSSSIDAQETVDAQTIEVDAYSYAAESVGLWMGPSELGPTYFDRPPAWLGTAWFDLMLLHRTDADSVELIESQATGDTVFNGEDFTFHTNAGFRFNWILAHESGTDLIVGYMGTRLGQERSYSSGSMRSRYFNYSTEPVDEGTGDPVSQAMEAQYDMTVDSVELLWRARRWPRFAPIAGIRFAQLKDEFGHWTGGNTFLNRATADNDLWGVQFGGDFVLYANDRFRLEATAKAGVYYNDLDLSGDSGPLDIGTGTIEPDFKENFQHVSTLMEATVQLVYQPYPNMALRIGYNAMWFDGVALIPDQYDNFDPHTQEGTIDLTTVLLYGSHAGLEFTW